MYRSTFSTSAPVGGKWSASRTGRFTPGEKAPGTHWIGGWVDPRVAKYCAGDEIPPPLRGFSPQANYTDRATAACRRS
jgi:hypothetical protein